MYRARPLHGAAVRHASLMQPHAPISQRYQTDSEKPGYVEKLFDAGSSYYDRTVGWGFFGSGKFYRRWAQQKHGLKPGMKVLDVASGTGLVAEAAARVLGSGKEITCVDPSQGMLSHVSAKVPEATLLVGRADALPVPDAQFDFLTMGYALRHVGDLETAFGEYHRALKPGGKVLLLEVTKPARGLRAWLFRAYFKNIYPALTRLFTRSAEAKEMMLYFWETMDAFVPPEQVLAALRAAGFRHVERRVLMGLFSEYIAVK
jgi:demethylmenaquinone methyltransferase / 2-methoxy-6-polyprenyl-1,4-benzoquinol methylase